MSARQGYTLVEALLVMAVLAIALTSSIPAFSGLLDRQRLRAAATALHDVFQAAQSEALRRSTTIGINLRSAEERWCVAPSDNGACDCLQAGACRLAGIDSPVLDGERFPGVHLGTNFPAGVALFHPPRGTATAGTARLENRAGRAEVVVNSLGRIRACASPAFERPPC